MYPPHQNQPQPQPGWGPPPGPPKKSVGKMVGIGCLGAVAAVVALGILGAIIGVGEEEATTSSRPPAAAEEPAPEEPQTTEERTQWGDGDYIAGEDMPPGTYVSEGAQKGIFELCSATTEDGEWSTGNAGEQVILKVTEDSGTVSISGCEPFVQR